jgi:hypothetical protein
MTTSSKTSQDKRQIRSKKDNAKYAKVLSLSEQYNLVTHSRAPLDSTATDPKTRSPKHHETSKKETLPRLYLCLVHSS